MAEPILEEDIRKTKDILVEGIVDTQIRAGLIPDVGLAAEWYEPILDKTIKEVEEQRSAGPAPATAPTPARERSEDDQVKTRALGEVNLRTGEFVPSVEAKPRRVPSYEEQWIGMRMRLLTAFPDWRAKLYRAFVDPGSRLERAARMITVLDQSTTTFGDWRSPTMPSSPIHFT